MSFWNVELREMMQEAAVPGAAVAILRNGQIKELANYGVRDLGSAMAVDENTIFDAASLSKPVFAYLVLRLVDQGNLKLDDPLCHYLPSYLASDPRSTSITIKYVLSHCTGLPNWRNLDFPLRTHFPPGERFSYSGEGFLYLQRAIEHSIGQNLEALAQRLVFEPLGMSRSSFTWQVRFEDNRAYPHDVFGMAALANKPAEANAAATLQTCAADYSRFLRAVLNNERLRKESARLWLDPLIEVKHRGSQHLGPSAEDVDTGVAWGLGWGLEPAYGAFFHWGDNGAYKAFTIGLPQERSAMVAFTNGASGLAVMAEIVANFIPGKRPSLDWLDYGRHDAPERRLLRAVLMHGAEAAWSEIESAGLKRDQLMWIAQGLNARGREQESRWLREHFGAT